MKGNLSKMLRSVLSMVLALCLIVGLCPAAFATEVSEMDVDATIEEIKELAKKAGYSDAEIDFAFQYAESKGYTEEDIAEKYEEKKAEGMTEDEMVTELETRREEIVAEATQNAKATVTEYIKNKLDQIATMVTENPAETYAALYAVLSDRGYINAATKSLTALEDALNAVPADKLPEAAAAELAAAKAAVAKLKAALADDVITREGLLEDFALVKEHVANVVAQVKASDVVKDAAIAVALAWDVFAADRIPAILNKIVEVTKEIGAEYKDEIVAKAKELTALAEAKVAEIPADVKAEVKAELQNAIAELKVAVQLLVEGQERAALSNVLDAVDAVVAAVKATGVSADEVIAKAKEITIAVCKAIYNRYIAATHDEYTVTYGSSYVALGDASAASESYADLVAKELHLHYTNLAEAEMKTVGETYAVIEANKDTIAAADLITIGYGNNAFAINALSEIVEGNGLDINWNEKVGETAANYIVAALNDIETYLVENGVSAENAALATAAVEAYAYSAASYAWNMPQLVQAVREINEDAVVIMVGMYNPLENVTVDVKGVSIEIGDYIDYLVDLVAVHGLGYAMLTQDAIYVNAPAVETEYEAAGKTNVMDIVAVMDYVASNGAEMNASAAGDEYIKDQIIDALTIDYRGIYRLWGDNRFETAMKVADEMKYLNNVEKFENMIIASGENYPDALAGTYLATAKEAPILLSYLNDHTGEHNFDKKTVAYIAANLAEGGKVYILGGPAAVTEDMEALLADAGIENVERLGGANRFETNKLILDEIGVTNEEVLVCTGADFADTLAASATKLPILLVYNKTGLYDYQKEFLAGLNGNDVTILGGTAAVTEEIEAAVEAAAGTEADRVWGETRIETSIAVAKKYFPGNVQMVLATGWEFADALCGGSLAATQDAPVVLTMGAVSAKGYEFSKKWDYGTVVYENYVAPAGLNQGIILGGTAEKCIPDALARDCYNLPDDAVIYTK
ncbi:MAG: cell wall-binding repeat-containing protein [Oscillospiraceae bacterium]|nr:cell wall-binding repeat-containing protein [Oscillospiraceae bacterium]